MIIKLTTLILSLLLLFFYLIYFMLMRKHSNKENIYDKEENEIYIPSISVIIPTYNEEISIERKLKNVFKQNYANFNVNIIDSDSTDDTVAIIKRVMSVNNFKINLIEENERKGKAYALNKVFKKCNGEIIFITDADVILENNALEQVVKNFSNTNIGAVTGRQILANKDLNLITSNEKAYKNTFDILRKGESNLDSTMIFNGPAMAFRSKLIDQIPEDTIADDTYLAMMIREKGYKTLFDDSIIFYESVPTDQRNFMNQKIRRGQGLVQAFLKFPQFLFNKKYGVYGMILFPAEFFMHIISPIISLLLSILYFSLIINDFIYLYFFLGLTLSILLLSRIRSLNLEKIILAFVEYQFILLLSLITHSIGVKQHKWTVIDRNISTPSEGE